ATVVAGAVAQLVLDEGGRTRTVPLSGDTITVGRRNDNDVVIAIPYVSGRHCRLERDGAGHRIVDAGSTHGLLYNGARIEKHVLADGDVLRIPDPYTANYVTLTYVNPMVPRAKLGTGRAFDLPRTGAV